MSQCVNNQHFLKRSQEKYEKQLYLSPSSDFFLEDSLSGNNPSTNDTFRRLENQLQVEIDQEKERSKLLKEKLKCREKSFYELKEHLEELRLNYELKEKECEMLKGSNQLLFELSARKDSRNSSDESFSEQLLPSNPRICKQGLLSVKLIDEKRIHDSKNIHKAVESINNDNEESMIVAEKRLEEIRKKKLQWYNSCAGLKSHQSEDFKSQKTTRASENSSYQEEQVTRRSERKCQDCDNCSSRENYQNNLLVCEINKLQEYVSRQQQKEEEMEQKYTQIAENQQEIVSDLRAEIERIKLTYAKTLEEIQSECFGIIQIMQSNNNSSVNTTATQKLNKKQLNYPCSDIENNKISLDKKVDYIFQSLSNIRQNAQNCSESVILCENLKQMMVNTPTLHNRQLGGQDLITLQDCWRHFKLVNQHYLQLLNQHKNNSLERTQTQTKSNRANSSNKSCDSLAKNNKNIGQETKHISSVIRIKRNNSTISKEQISQKSIQHNRANSNSSCSHHKINSQQVRNPTQIQAQKILKQPGFSFLPHSPHSAISVKSVDTTLPLSNPFQQENRKSSIHSIGKLSTVDASFKAVSSQADLRSHQEFKQQQNKEQQHQQKHQGFQRRQELEGPRQQAFLPQDHYSRSRSSNNSQPRMATTPNFS